MNKTSQAVFFKEFAFTSVGKDAQNLYFYVPFDVEKGDKNNVPLLIVIKDMAEKENP